MNGKIIVTTAHGREKRIGRLRPPENKQPENAGADASAAAPLFEGLALAEHNSGRARVDLLLCVVDKHPSTTNPVDIEAGGLRGWCE